jgi:mRNA-degrading endonuclease RelE of RelBE toxin-antitoxin system
MAGRGFELIYAPQVARHLRRIDRKHHSLIQRTIERQLRFEPDTETRNRKPLDPPSTGFGAWELRLGPKSRFRVFYEVLHAAAEVHVLAIGEKRRHQLWIGGEEIEL